MNRYMAGFFFLYSIGLLYSLPLLEHVASPTL